MANREVGYAFYVKFRDIYSSVKLKVKFSCEVCGEEHTSDFKHLNKRTVVDRAVCPKCVMKVATSDEAWRKRNSEAQLKVQSRPSQKAANAAGVAKFWRENPERLAMMRAKVIAACQTEEVRAKYRDRKAWNGRGISGLYLSKWDWIKFDSSYELAVILAMEDRDDVISMKRGPAIDYEFDGKQRQFFIDFEIAFSNGESCWCEVKSAYIGKQRDRIEKLRAKMQKTKEVATDHHIDKVIMITEKNAEEFLGKKLPRSSYRLRMLRDNSAKIVFARKDDQEKYSG